jgi:cell growth-regulating nucleolar protein
MPSFVCDFCQETLKKQKLEQHRYHCKRATYSCIDCGVSFRDESYQAHTSCITEAEKYQKSLYKPTKYVGKPKKIVATSAPTDSSMGSSDGRIKTAYNSSNLSEVRDETTRIVEKLSTKEEIAKLKTISSKRSRNHEMLYKIYKEMLREMKEGSGISLREFIQSMSGKIQSHSNSKLEPSHRWNRRLKKHLRISKKDGHFLLNMEKSLT